MDTITQKEFKEQLLASSNLANLIKAPLKIDPKLRSDHIIRIKETYYYLPYEIAAAYNSCENKENFVIRLPEIKYFPDLQLLIEAHPSINAITDQNNILAFNEKSQFMIIHPDRQILEFGLEYRLKKRIENLDAFNSTLIHDIRAPLTVINICSDYLLSLDTATELALEAPEFIERIKTHSSKGLKLSESLLDVFKSKQDGKLKKSKISIKNLLNKIAKESGPLANEKNIKIKVQSDDFDLFLDEARISQAIENLVGNAIKFSEENKNIYLITDKNPESLSITVKDQGPGIEPSLLATIFEKYRQLDHSTNKKIGAGLGLSIAKHFIQMHGGDITVESKLGEGSSFTANLPIINQKAFSKVTEILVVDDDEDIRDFIGRTLDKHGLKFYQACDGVEAINLFKLHKPGIIISDIKMPNMDGFELLGNIQNIAPETHFIFISGYYPQITNTKAKKAFKTAKFLQKPFMERDIVEIIETLT